MFQEIAIRELALGVFEGWEMLEQAVDVRGCLGKLFDVEIELLWQAKRQKTQLTATDLPRLWILTPAVSKSVWQGFGAIEKEDGSKGMYFLSAHLGCGLYSPASCQRRYTMVKVVG